MKIQNTKLIIYQIPRIMKNSIKNLISFSERERVKRDLTSRNRTILIEFCNIYLNTKQKKKKKTNSI